MTARLIAIAWVGDRNTLRPVWAVLWAFSAICAKCLQPHETLLPTRVTIGLEGPEEECSPISTSRCSCGEPLTVTERDLPRDMLAGAVDQVLAHERLRRGDAA